MERLLHLLLPTPPAEGLGVRHGGVFPARWIGAGQRAQHNRFQAGLYEEPKGLSGGMPFIFIVGLMVADPTQQAPLNHSSNFYVFDFGGLQCSISFRARQQQLENENRPALQGEWRPWGVESGRRRLH